MLTRKKESGFTLVELMIVLAIIGILAVVLIPKMSGMKDSAKSSGVTVNAKSVEAYIVANIDRWEDAAAATTAINTYIGGNDFKNPVTGVATGLNVVAGDSVPSVAKGVVTVYLEGIGSGASATWDKTKGIVIRGYDENSKEIYKNTIKP